MNVEIKEFPALRVAGVEHVGPYTEIGQAFSRLGAIAGRAGLFQQPAPIMIALYHDDPESTPANQLRSDAGVTVPEGIALPEGLIELRVPAGLHACYLHTGPYEQLSDAWARLKSEWLPKSGRRRREGAPSCEVYLNDPMRTPKQELKTEIRIPLIA